MVYGYSSRAMLFRPFHALFFWIWVGCCIGLGWVGGAPAATPYIEFGQLFSLYFFFYLIVINFIFSNLD
jgi:ubiquinol-cytochrome c reductase cytochrome b subunit